MTLRSGVSAASAQFSVLSGSSGNTIARHSQQAHQLAASQPPEGSEPSGGLAAIEAQVDEAAAELWGIKDKELKEICRSLKELE